MIKYNELEKTFQEVSTLKIELENKNNDLNILKNSLENKVNEQTRELREEKDLIDNLFNNINAVVATIKPDGTMNKVNKYTENLTGYTQKEIASKPFFWFEKFIPSNVKPDIKQIINSLEKNHNVSAKKENEWIVKNNELRLFEWSNKVINGVNEPNYLLTVGVDITERTKIKNDLESISFNLEKNNKELKQIQMLSKIGSWEIKYHSKEFIISNEFRKIYGLIEQKDYLLEDLFLIVHKDDRIIVQNKMTKSLDNFCSDSIIHRIVVNGIIKYINMQWETIFDEQNELVSFQGYVQDVTETEINRIELKEKTIQLEQQLKKNEEQQKIMLLQTKQAAMGEMISMIAHQWRQPLATLNTTLANISVKKQLNLLSDEDLKNGIKRSNKTIKYMSETIDDFRNFFKDETKKETITVKKQIEKSEHLISPSLKMYNISFEIKYEVEENFEFTIYSSKFSQVLINLYKNAFDELISRKIQNPKIKTKIRKIEDYIIFEISDNAGGISQEIIGKIFEPYFSTKGKNGTGIGLYMSKIIIEDQLNGSLFVSNSEVGAIFTIKIPYIDSFLEIMA